MVVNPTAVGTRLGALLVAVASLAAISTGGVAHASTSATTSASARPNIVFILTDDLSWNLVDQRFAPHLLQLEHRGETFDHYFVADSLCCPSRSTIFTGLFPHDTHVFTNLPPDGGFQKFQSEGLDQKTWALALSARGDATSMLGKYLNGYGNPLTPQNAPIPPGWSDWHVSNNTGYREFDYFLNDNGTFNFYSGPDKYGVDVLNTDAQSFIDEHAGKPFALEVATFAPHKPYTPALRNANDFPGLTEPRDPSFNTDNVNPPAWLGQRRPLGPQQIAGIDAAYRKRAQAVEAVDKLLADTEANLAAHHLTDDTYIVFSSDNGYHLGQHRLLRGKQTAFDTDIRVPLVVAGPGVPHGRVVHKVVQNTDLFPTFVQLAGGKTPPSVEGRSLVPLLHPSKQAPSWRTVALVEHRGTGEDPTDPDFEGKGATHPTTYEAIRISTSGLTGFDGPVEAVYVEYADSRHEREYYDIKKDPYERRNVAGTLSAKQRTELHHILVALESCHGGNGCWSAGRPRS